MLTPESAQQQFHTLYSDHHAWLFAWLRKRLGCSDNAADLLQDTFLRIMTSRAHLPGIVQPRAYLTTTAKRLMIDQQRRQLLERAYLAELEHIAAHSRHSPAPEITLIAVEALMHISLVLEGVSSRAREAFLLHYLDGQTQTYIATHLGVSTRMVHKYLAQVLVHCHALIEASAQ